MTGSPAQSSPDVPPASSALRVLITAVPIPGHLLPLLPLAHAIADAGDHAALAVPASMANLVDGLPVCPTGPDIATLTAENDRRTGAADMTDPRDISPVAELFAATRVDLTFDDALGQARRMHPHVILTDEYDSIGPMLASALAVPLIVHAIGLPVSPPALAPAMETLLAPRYAQHGLAPARRLALVDPWPPGLHDPHWSPPPDRQAIRAEPYTAPAPAGQPPLPPPSTRPRVLVTLGTVLLDGGLLAALVDGVAAVDEVDVLALIPPGVTHPAADPRANVRFLGFTPMAQLLATGISVVMAAGGAGTVLAAMSHSIPMVLLPKGAEKPQNAKRVAAAGAGITITDPTQAGAAVRTVLADPSYRTSAAQIAHQINQAPDANQVWVAVRKRLTAINATGNAQPADGSGQCHG